MKTKHEIMFSKELAELCCDAIKKEILTDCPNGRWLRLDASTFATDAFADAAPVVIELRDAVDDLLAVETEAETILRDYGFSGGKEITKILEEA